MRKLSLEIFDCVLFWTILIKKNLRYVLISEPEGESYSIGQTKRRILSQDLFTFYCKILINSCLILWKKKLALPSRKIVMKIDGQSCSHIEILLFKFKQKKYTIKVTRGKETPNQMQLLKKVVNNLNRIWILNAPTHIKLLLFCKWLKT